MKYITFLLLGGLGFSNMAYASIKEEAKIDPAITIEVAEIKSLITKSLKQQVEMIGAESPKMSIEQQLAAQFELGTKQQVIAKRELTVDSIVAETEKSDSE